MKIIYEKEDLPELQGQIIDVFDDFLEKRDIRIPSSDEAMLEDDPDWEENGARLYGRDYDEIADGIREVISAWSKKGEKEASDCVSRYRNLLKDYFSDQTIQGQIQKRGRFEELEWTLQNCMGLSSEEVKKIYDEEYSLSKNR